MVGIIMVVDILGDGVLGVCSPSNHVTHPNRIFGPRYLWSEPDSSIMWLFHASVESYPLV